jgi:hypothetical protein
MTKAVEFGVVCTGALALSMLVGCSESSDAGTGGSTADAGATVTDAAPAADTGSTVVTDAGADAASTTDAAVDASSALDAGGPTDAGRGPDGAADAGNGLVCNRFRVTGAGTGAAGGACPGPGCDGSGSVFDTTTGATWQRFSYLPAAPQTQTQAQAAAYCLSKGMRLPTLQQVQAIADRFNFCLAAWPAGWRTWTSTTFGTTEAYNVDTGGVGIRAPLNQNDHAFCVRVSSGGPQ